MSRFDKHSFVMELHHETDAAVRVSDTGDDDDAIWLPKSQIDITDNSDGTVTLEVPEWLAEDKGLI